MFVKSVPKNFGGVATSISIRDIVEYPRKSRYMFIFILVSLGYFHFGLVSHQKLFGFWNLQTTLLKGLF
jgi:hypothetical protein